ncbi:PASTA domain-containing protein [Mycobacterium sp. MS1601]|uniref:PASTA domain-containing protein n=1 Tax=Mycobacterium sp. MS1601 TaxID=1936029 RepID=UPI00178CC88A
MPSVRGITLTKATEAITSLSPTTKFRINPVVRGGEPIQILSPGSWVVCRQSPAAGRNITARTTLTLQVERPWNGC